MVMEWLTLAAILIGPIASVAITLWIEQRRRQRESRMIVLRLLMATRHLPGDANYSTAINLIPVEFNDVPAVMSAFKDYQQKIRSPRQVLADDLARQTTELANSQVKLVSSVLTALGMKVSEADLAIEAYAADGMIQRDNLYLKSLEAQIRTADALERAGQLQIG